MGSFVLTAIMGIGVLEGSRLPAPSYNPTTLFQGTLELRGSHGEGALPKLASTPQLT
jgi:hypothetical protein